jgi:hypothetical protein
VPSAGRAALDPASGERLSINTCRRPRDESFAGSSFIIHDPGLDATGQRPIRAARPATGPSRDVTDSGLIAAIASGEAVLRVRAPVGEPSPSMKWSRTTASAASAIRAKNRSGSAIGRSGATVIRRGRVRRVRSHFEEVAPAPALGHVDVVPRT